MSATTEKKKLEVGQTVYARFVGDERRKPEKTIRETKITKVGKVYFTVDQFPESRFYIETLKMDGGGYSSNWTVYFDRQTILDEEEAGKKISQIRLYFGNWMNKPTIEQARQIHKILNLPE